MATPVERLRPSLANEPIFEVDWVTRPATRASHDGPRPAYLTSKDRDRAAAGDYSVDRSLAAAGMDRQPLAVSRSSGSKRAL